MIEERRHGTPHPPPMAKDGKFGTLAGVFTPSILTILGVIMYLRLPWLVGNAGLYMVVGIILVAHVVSVTTGLSVSSIATDKKVGAGGPYYIISRSFGLPIGGAVGLALFLGLSFSISLYIVGFSESFLPTIGFEPTKDAIRVCGSATIVALTVITFISTSLAIKAQFVILAVIVLSLASIFLGTPSAVETQTGVAEGAPSFAVMFGIFFPAVTGFTAGVNMSGDLRDPKGSIPKGTMLAIGAGLAVYVGLAVFLAMRVDGAALRDDKRVLERAALIGPLVVAGVWSATLSSALGSILGAPRILQAMSVDRITPRIFARGYGPTSEPRTALMLAFAIGEAGILLAELDLIARVVSMVFLAMYASINITCAIESWASSDFRPRFRIPKLLSIIGAVTSVLLMIQLDIVAMLGASVMLLSIYGLLTRRQLSLESGDTWEGVWSTVVRAGLQRLSKPGGERRNWRPNVLLFDEAGHPRHPAIREFAVTLASGNGMVTDFALGKAKAAAAEPPADPEASRGVFDQQLATSDPLATAAVLCQYHGFTGLRPNTVLLPWRAHHDAADAFLSLLRTAASANLNLLLFEDARDPLTKTGRRIDVWWSREAGNLALSVALVRFITRAATWERAEITVVIAGDDVEEDELLRVKAARFLDEARLDAKVKLVARPRTSAAFAEVITRQSSDARLVLFGLPDEIEGATHDTLTRLEQVAALPGGVVFLRAGDGFRDVLAAPPRAARRTRAPTDADQPAELPPLELPGHPRLADAATLINEHLSARLTRAHERIVARAYATHVELCDATRALVEQRADGLIAAGGERNPARRKKLVTRTATRFLREADQLQRRFEDDDVMTIANQLGAELASLVDDDAKLLDTVPWTVRITRPRAELRAAPDDPAPVRRWKRRQRWRYFYRRQLPQSIAIGELVRHSHDRMVCDAVVGAVARFRADSREVLGEVGRALANAEWKAVAELSRSAVDDSEAVVERLTRSRDAAVERLAELREQLRSRVSEHRTAVAETVYAVSRQLYADLDRVDATVAARAARKRDKRDLAALAGLGEVAETWRSRQTALLKRVRLATRLAGFRAQLTATVIRHLDEIMAGMHGSGRKACAALREALAARTAGEAELPPPEVKDELPFEAGPIISRFSRAAAAITGELPDAESVLTDEAAATRELDAALAQVSVPVRSAVQGLVETDLITRLQSEAVKLAEADSRAWTAARDSVRLLSAQAGAHGEDDDEDEAGAAGATVEHSIQRLDAQLAKLAEADAGLVQAVYQGMEQIAAATAIDDLGTALDAVSRRGRDRDRPSRLRALVRRWVAWLRELAARAVYRRSAGMVFARETRAARQRTAAHAIRDLTVRSAASSTTLAEVPLSYRHLFTGQININESFFFGRDDKVAAAAAVLSGDNGSGPRAVLISGERGSGKTTLCQQITTAAGGTVYWLTAPATGTTSRVEVRAALEAAVGGRGNPAAMVARLEPGTVIVVDDLDLWWERHPGGLDAIDEIIDLVTGAGDQVGFVLAGSSHAVAMLDALRGLSRITAAHLLCQPLTARELQQVIMARHSSTGLRLKLGRRSEESLGAWSRARLFDDLFDYARGNVGYALRAWIAHVSGYADEVLTVRRPTPLDWDALDDLRPELIAILVELLLHRNANVDKLQRLTGRPTASVRSAVAELCAMGLTVQNRRRVVQINPFSYVPVVDWLERRELA